VGASVAAGVGATALSRGVGLLRGVVLAWLMPASQFGLLGLAMLVVNVMLPVVSLGLYEGAVRFAPVHEAAGSLRRFVRRSLWLGASIAIASTFGIWMFSETIGPFLFSAASHASSGKSEPPESDVTSVWMLRSILPCLIALNVFHIAAGCTRGLRMFRALGLADALHSLLFTALAIAAVWVVSQTAPAVMTAYALAGLVAAGYALTMLARRAEPSPDRRIQVGESAPPISMLGYSGWSAATALLVQFALMYPVWFILRYADADCAGAYQGLRLFIQFLQVGAVLLTGIVFAHVARSWEIEGRDAALKRWRRMTQRTVLALLVGAVGMSLLRWPAMRILPVALRSAEIVYDPMILYFMVVGLAGLLATRLLLVARPGWVSLAWVLGVGVTIGATPQLFALVLSEQKAAFAAMSAATWAGAIGGVVTVASLLAIAVFVRLPFEWDTSLLVAAAISSGFGWRVAGPIAMTMFAFFYFRGLFRTTVPITAAVKHESRT
jgi:O-antigen/teichoic acid export membrane protein